MTYRLYAVEGDLTTKGGYCIVNGHRTSTICGKYVLVEGDLATCPACGQQGYLMCDGSRHPSDTIEGKHHILDNDLVMGCACPIPPRVIAGGQTIAGQDNTGFGTAIASSRISKQYDEQFILKDANGTPMPDTYYTVKLPTGGLQQGITDANGKTDRIVTDSAQPLDVYLGHREEV